MELIKKRISKHWPLLSKGVLKARPLQGVTSPTPPSLLDLSDPFNLWLKGPVQELSEAQPAIALKRGVPPQHPIFITEKG